MKKIVLNIAVVTLVICSLVILFHNKTSISDIFRVEKDNDSVSQFDVDKLTLSKGKVTVDFSEVLLSEQEERRKLIVSEQNATVTSTLTYRLVEKMDFQFLKKTQDVKYTGKAYFVVDLDHLKPENIIDDKENKVLTIAIEHAHLDVIEINPDNIVVGDVKEGLLARGDIMLSLKDYKVLESNLIEQMKTKINLPSNAQIADVNARESVRKIYEPIVKAIDEEYTVKVDFVR